MSTFIGTVLLDVDGGLVTGIVATISAIVGRSILSHSSVLAPLPDGLAVVETEVYQTVFNWQPKITTYNLPFDI